VYFSCRCFCSSAFLSRSDAAEADVDEPPVGTFSEMESARRFSTLATRVRSAMEAIWKPKWKDESEQEKSVLEDAARTPLPL